MPYATGSKQRPCLSFYDAGDGQLPENFPNTFCSLVYGTDEGSYKGAVPFVQGRFNMGGTGVLPFCGEDRKMQQRTMMPNSHKPAYAPSSMAGRSTSAARLAAGHRKQ